MKMHLTVRTGNYLLRIITGKELESVKIIIRK